LARVLPATRRHHVRHTSEGAHPAHETKENTDMSATVTTPVGSRVATEPAAAPKGAIAWGITRIMLGWIFLWAFIDKALGLGFATERADAWVNGGSPTYGFLEFGTAGPFAGAYQAIAGAAWADWLFMVGLLGLGVALMLGIGMRIAAVSGTVLLVMMWSAALPPATNPFLTYHLIWAVTLIGLAAIGAGRYVGFGRAWERLSIVQKFPFLK
jgi:thiosulfate dehydrogenase (quinone) large subunit